MCFLCQRFWYWFPNKCKRLHFEVRTNIRDGSTVRIRFSSPSGLPLPTEVFEFMKRRNCWPEIIMQIPTWPELKEFRSCVLWHVDGISNRPRNRQSRIKKSSYSPIWIRYGLTFRLVMTYTGSISRWRSCSAFLNIKNRLSVWSMHNLAWERLSAKLSTRHCWELRTGSTLIMKCFARSQYAFKRVQWFHKTPQPKWRGQLQFFH